MQHKVMNTTSLSFTLLVLSMCVIFFLGDHMLSVHALQHLIPSASSHMLQHLIHPPVLMTLLNSPTAAAATASNPSDTILLLLDQLFLINPHDSNVDMNSLTIESSSQVLVPPLVPNTITYSDPIYSSFSEQIHHTTLDFAATTDLRWTHDMQLSSTILSQASDLSLNGPLNGPQLQLIDSLRDIVYAKYSEVTTSSLHLPSFGDPSSATAAPLIDISVVGTLINEVIAALTRATSSFTTQLSQKGDELVANTQSSLNSIATSLPNDAINSAASSISAKVISIGRWKLFSDDNHWVDGYWEQRITSLQRLLVELEQVENRRKYIDWLAGAVSESISGVGPRFIDQYNVKRAEYRDVDAQVVAAWESVKTSVEQADRVISEFLSDEQRSSIIDAIGRSVEGFTSQFIDQYDPTKKRFDEASSSSPLVVLVSSLWDLLTSVTDSTVNGIRTYVDDFISTGQDL